MSVNQEPEIIDVDEFVINESQRQQPEVISLLDSDDELEPTQGSSSHRTTGTPVPRPSHRQTLRRRPNGHYASLPPPSPVSHPTPPIPEPPIRANPVPFAFEANLRPRSPPPHYRRAPLAAPRSNHLPNMGFGSALIDQLARNNQNQTDVAQPRHRPWYARPTLLGMFRNPLLGFAYEGLDFGFEDGDGDGAGEQLDYEAFNRRFTTRVETKEPDFKTHYTHPIPHSPGFTYDFAPVFEEPIVIPDEDVTSSPPPPPTSSETVLVCAKCADPLLITSEIPDADTQEIKRRKLWALRCGHLIDGKCLVQLSRPPLHPTPSSSTTIDGKGKAKAKADDSIRKRLRPRPQSTSTHPTSGYKRKHGHSTSVPVVPQHITHAWSCPVPECSRLHVSVLDEEELEDGGWVQDKERGAVTMFV